VYRLDPADSGYTLTPKPDEPKPDTPEQATQASLTALAAAWDRGNADGDERTASYRLLSAMLDPSGALPDGLSARVVDFLANVPRAKEAFRKRVARRLEHDLPERKLRDLVRVDVEAFVGGLSLDGLRRADEPISDENLAEYLLSRVKAQKILSEVAKKLEEWAAPRAGGASRDPTERQVFAELNLFGLRWQPVAWQRVEPLREKGGVWTSAVARMREWMRGGTPNHLAVINGPQAEEVANRLLVGNPPMEFADEQLLAWQVAVAEAESPVSAELRFALAARWEDEKLGEYLRDSTRRPAQKWLDNLIGHLRFGYGVVYWEPSGGLPRVGVAISAPPDTHWAPFLLRVLVEDARLRPVFLRRGADYVLNAARAEAAGAGGNLLAAASALDNVGYGRLADELAKLSVEQLRRFLKDNVIRKFGRLAIDPPYPAETGATWLTASPVAKTKDADMDKLWQLVIKSARKVDYDENVRGAAVVDALMILVKDH
jgi:hypothetical protein